MQVGFAWSGVTNFDSGTVSAISVSNNTKVRDIPVGSNPYDIAVDHKSDTIYVVNYGSNTVSAINGTTHRVENIPVGKSPQDIAVHDNSDTIYVTNFGSNGLSVIDGISKQVVAGVLFNINPVNSGHIVCNKINVPINQYLYLSSGTVCTAIPNTGFGFSSWVENLENNASRTISTSNVSNSFLNPLLGIFDLRPNDPGATLNVTQFGSFTGNFRALPPAIPPEYLTVLFGIMVGTFAPSIFRWLNGRRQGKNLRKLIDRIDSEHSNLNRVVLENEIINLYAEGKIGDAHYALLKDKISEYYPDTTKE